MGERTKRVTVNKDFTQAQVDALKAMGFEVVFAHEPVVKDVPYTKADGTTIMASQAQVNAWNTGKARLEQESAAWSEKKEAYKPSQALVDALKANPAMSRKDALAYDFVGTKKDLAALKRELKLR